MKRFNKPVFSLSLILFGAPLFLGAAPAAQVISEQPDGATYVRGAAYEVSSGMSLMEGDRLETGNATVILSFADGSLLTAYPGTALEVAGSGNGSVSLTLSRGEILGDASGMTRFTVMTKAGTTTASGGVFGILQSETGGDNWSLQVRNLNATVDFMADMSLNTGDVTASLLEPGKTVSISSGEEVVVRGVYNESANVFTLAEDGGALVAIDAGTVAELREASEQMSSAVLPEMTGGPESPVMIEIPFEDVETASDKG
ncbi:MAG TPA: FecR domain-containing protein [Oceanipulchritudo sp.]|nr:FecR domain-containing protein [Oceanipulchritudo sp.]